MLLASLVQREEVRWACCLGVEGQLPGWGRDSGELGQPWLGKLWEQETSSRDSTHLC